jgi:hypothetical protein
LAGSCLAPPRPFVPSDSQAARDYADLIRGDFETYILDIQSYFRCLDGERARAFEEARDVSEDYGRFLQVGRGLMGCEGSSRSRCPWKTGADNTLTYLFFR